MILVDANILLYDQNHDAPQHQAARTWWEQQLSGTDTVCLCWPVINAYLRISTNRKLFTNPLSTDDAIDRVSSWFAQPCVRLAHAGERHWEIFADLLRSGQVTANLVTDAHVAAIAIENNCELQSTDADFSRFPNLRWRNPLKVTT